MKNVYKKALAMIKQFVKNSEVSRFCEGVADKFSDAAKKLTEGEELNLDLAKIIGLIQGLAIVKKRKSSTKKKFIYSIVIASLIVMATIAAVKVYEDLNSNGDFEKRIKRFLKKMNVEKIVSSPLIKKIRKEIRESID